MRSVRAKFLDAGRWIVVLALATTASSSWARMTTPPASTLHDVRPLSTTQSLELSPRDLERQSAQDVLNDQRPGPTRFAVSIVVDISLENAGTWETLGDGARLWRLRIRSPGALSLNLGFSDFDLPAGAGLWIYDPSGDQVQGPYTRHHRAADGQLWTALILGDEIVVELYLPPDAGDARADIRAVNHGIRFFGEPELEQGSCNIDVACPEVDPYRDQVRSVARYTHSGVFLCTGTLVNNTAMDFRPFFLTADHCDLDEANASSVVVYWNFESPSCGQLSGGSLADNQSGATFRASSTPSDFALIELDQMPDPTSRVYYAGWDATGATPQSVVGIHHPSGDEKAAAFETDPLVGVDIGNGGITHWEVSAWDSGTTEPGSSGSCIFDQTTRRCVGTHTGGFASCDNPTGSNVYGKFSLAWTGDGTDSTRLSSWLDPLNGGATLTIEGADKAFIFADGFESGDVSAW